MRNTDPRDHSRQIQSVYRVLDATCAPQADRLHLLNCIVSDATMRVNSKWNKPHTLGESVKRVILLLLRLLTLLDLSAYLGQSVGDGHGARANVKERGGFIIDVTHLDVCLRPLRLLLLPTC